MPETWGHRRRSCSKLSATDQPEALTPVAVLQSPCRISNIPTNLLLHVLGVPHTEIYTCSIWAKRNHRSSNLEKRGFHVLWLQRVTRSWPRPRARLSIPLLCRRYMGTWLWSMRGNEERGTTCGGQCWCFHSANPSPCELNSAAPLKSLKCSVWTHHHAVWACEGKKRISSNFLGTNLRCPAFSFMLCDKFCLDKRQLTQRAPQAGLISVDFSLFTG